MLVLLLPSDVITSIFLEWIEMEELGKLDRSMTNKLYRNQFLLELSREAIVYNGLDKVNVEYCAWLKLRGLKVNTLHIGRGIVRNVTEQFPFVQNLFFHLLYSEEETDALMTEMSKCIKLKHLTIHDPIDFKLRNNICQIPNPTLLLSLSFRNTTNVVNMSLLQILSRLCPNIEQLDLCDMDNLNDPDDCSYTHLKELVIGQCSDMAIFFDYIIHKSHKIENIECYCYDNDTLVGIEMDFTKLSTQATHLKKFSIRRIDCVISSLQQLLVNATALQQLSIDSLECEIHDVLPFVTSKCVTSLLIVDENSLIHDELLRYLEMKGSILQSITIHINVEKPFLDVLLTTIKENCPALKELEYSSTFYSTCIIDLMKKCHYVQRLNIRWCRMTVDDFCQLAPHCNALVEIVIRLKTVDEKVVNCFVKYFPRLSVARLFNDWKRLNEYEKIQLNSLGNARRDVDFTKRF